MNPSLLLLISGLWEFWPMSFLQDFLHLEVNTHWKIHLSFNIFVSGETDQETLINITTATLDFPAELFEGVSEEAKEFIKECLNRNPK